MAFRNTLKLGAKISGGALGLGSAGSVGYGTYLYETDEGTRRAIKAYSSFVPVVLHYRFAEFRHNNFGPLSEEEWEALDEQYAVPTVAKLGELQGVRGLTLSIYDY